MVINSLPGYVTSTETDRSAYREPDIVRTATAIAFSDVPPSVTTLRTSTEDLSRQYTLLSQPDPPPAEETFCVATMFLISSSVLLDVKWYVLVINLWALFVVYLHKHQGYDDISEFSDASFREVGLAMSFLLIHRATVAYNFFWEARGAVGAITVHARDLVRKLCCYTSADRQSRLVKHIRHACARRVVMLFTAQRLKLEKADPIDKELQLASFLPFEGIERYSDEVAGVNSQAILSLINVDLSLLLSNGLIPSNCCCSIQTAVEALDAAITTTDKLHSTRFPVPYAQLLSLGILIFTSLIPLPFVSGWGWHISVPVTMSTSILFGIEFLARRMFQAFSRNAVSKGHPLFCMRVMGFSLQDQCWQAVKDAAGADQRQDALTAKHGLH